MIRMKKKMYIVKCKLQKCTFYYLVKSQPRRVNSTLDENPNCFNHYSLVSGVVIWKKNTF